MSIYQTLLSRPQGGKRVLPLTRNDWYASSLAAEEMQA